MKNMIVMEQQILQSGTFENAYMFISCTGDDLIDKVLFELEWFLKMQKNDDLDDYIHSVVIPLITTTTGISGLETTFNPLRKIHTWDRASLGEDVTDSLTYQYANYRLLNSYYGGKRDWLKKCGFPTIEYEDEIISNHGLQSESKYEPIGSKKDQREKPIVLNNDD